MNILASLSIFVVAAPMMLAHCSGAPVSDPGAAKPTASLNMSVPLDHSGQPIPATVDEPWDVGVQLLVNEPGGCGSTVGNGYHCSGPYTSPVAVTITSATCDDDLCDVTQFSSGDEVTGAVVTIVPKASGLTLRVTGANGSLSAAGSLSF